MQTTLGWYRGVALASSYPQATTRVLGEPARQTPNGAHQDRRTRRSSSLPNPADYSASDSALIARKSSLPVAKVGIAATRLISFGIHRFE
jgi:hypothetical protein